MEFIFFKILFFQILISIPIFYFSKKNKLVDIPSSRKVHLKPVPYTGGIIMSLTFLFLIFTFEFRDNYLNLILAYGFIISLSGLIDDRYNVRPGTKLLLQSIPVYFLIDQNLYLLNIGEYNFFGTINLGAVDKIFTFMCCLLIINASNYSDGIDGLLSSIYIISVLSFSIFLFILEYEYYSHVILFIIPVGIFLIFNLGILKNFKLFMGDSGSNLIGFIISFLTIYLYTEAQVHPALLIWALAYLVYDFLSVTILRVIKNNGTFKPGGDHFHYEIINFFKLKSHSALILILLIHIFLIFFGTLIYFNFGQDISLISFILLFLLFFFIKYFYLSKKKNTKLKKIK